MARQYRNEKACNLKHTKNHLRKDLGSEEELRQLGRSYLNNPWYPLICRPDLEVVEGNRRLAGLLLEHGPDAEVPICITDEVVSEAVKVEIQIESSIHQRGL